MNLLLEETIAAPASASGGGERAIIRVSGPSAKDAVDQLFTPDDPDRWRGASQPYRHTGCLQIATLPVPIAVAVSLWPSNRSYTGQPMAELHLIGSRPIVEAVLESLYFAGVRPARPGEFTQRAFLTGRLDLMQAEAVLGVIDADDPESLRQALRQLEGGISARIQACREELLLHLADLEAGLDFVEEDIDFVSRDGFRNRLTESLSLVADLLVRSTGRMRADGRPRIVLAGLPNAGKSTLLNALAETETAIVSPRAGTTRDVITVPVCCDGVWVDLTDTAGIESTADPILAIAQTLGRDEADRAAIIVWCTPIDLNGEECFTDQQARLSLSLSTMVIEVTTKSDRAAASASITEIAGQGTAQGSLEISADRVVRETGLDEQGTLLYGVPLRANPEQISPEVASAESSTNKPAPLRVSAANGEGLTELKRIIAQRLQQQSSPSSELLATSAARCRLALQHAHESLNRARETLDSSFGDEIVSMELRAALDALGSIAGTIYTDDILDRIFSRFCIGK